MHIPTNRTQDALVFLLAGGRGQRLFPLTRDRAKGAVPFGGQYRLIDFTLANCLRADLRRIFVLAQHRYNSLERHLRQQWNFSSNKPGEYLHIVPPRQSMISNGYQGTADAVRQNLHILSEERPAHVLILSSDHLYRMDYTRFLDYHRASSAQMTIASMQVPSAEAHHFGIMQTNPNGRVLNFIEKPLRHSLLNYDRVLASMGIYIFDTHVLVDILQDHLGRVQNYHDFGHDIIPHMLTNNYQVNVYDVRAGEDADSFYWRDIGTLDAYWEASMELLSHTPPFDFSNSRQTDSWPFSQPTRIREQDANTWVCSGATIDHAQVQRSILSPGVRVGRGAEITESILMDGAQVGAGARIHRTIIDKNVHIPANYVLGQDSHRDDFYCTPLGIAVLPKNIDLVRWQHEAQYARDYFGHGSQMRPFAPPDSCPVRALGQFQVLPPPPELTETAYRLVRSMVKKEKVRSRNPDSNHFVEPQPH